MMCRNDARSSSRRRQRDCCKSLPRTESWETGAVDPLKRARDDDDDSDASESDEGDDLATNDHIDLELAR